MSLNAKVRVTWDDLEVGRTLPWDVYTEGGKLLLKAGQSILNQQVLDGMHKYILYRYEHDGTTSHRRKQQHINVFEHIDTLIPRLKHVLTEIDTGQAGLLEVIDRLLEDIRHMCELEVDASLALLHLPVDYPLSLIQPIRCAIAATFIADAAKLGEQEKKMLMAAALTANVGIYDIEDQLATQDGMVTPDQDDKIRAHPEQGVRLLQAIGVQDPTWLSIVREHHERGDGSGYPGALSEEAISPGARILAIIDHYCSTVTAHQFTEALPLKTIFNQSFSDKGFAWDNQYTVLLEKVLGSYPPGSCVALNNGELGVVVKRGSKDPLKPIVKSFLGPDKKRYINPLYRECGLNGYEVDALSAHDPTIPLNYSHIWGFT